MRFVRHPALLRIRTVARLRRMAAVASWQQRRRGLRGPMRARCRWLSVVQLAHSVQAALTRSAVTDHLPSCWGTHDTSRQCVRVVGLVQCDSPPTMPVRRTARSRRGSQLATLGSQQPYGRLPDLPTQAATASPRPSMDPVSFPLDRSSFLGASTASQIPDTQAVGDPSSYRSEPLVLQSPVPGCSVPRSDHGRSRQGRL
jgi:hypothetical protein